MVTTHEVKDFQKTIQKTTYLIRGLLLTMRIEQ